MSGGGTIDPLVFHGRRRTRSPDPYHHVKTGTETVEETIALRKKLERDGRVLRAAKKLEAAASGMANLDSAARINLLRALVVGWLFRLWALGREYCTPDNVLRDFTEEDIDREMGYPGFAKILPDDWIQIDPQGRVILPGFRERENKEKSFSPSSASPLSSPTPPPISSPLSSPSSEKKGRRKGVWGKEQPPVIPANLNTPEFLAAWGEWEQHRKEMGHVMTNTSVGRLWKKLSEMGIDRALAAIEFSIRQGYRGIYEDDKSHGRKQAGHLGSDSRQRAAEGKYRGVGITIGEGATPPRAAAAHPPDGPPPGNPTPARRDRTLFENDHP